MSLRIIGGQWRSRKLARPDTPATRPMPDRVKQSIFNILGCLYESPGQLPPLRVADVFAGSGSMGFEALSRGASHCTFYEADRIALRALRENQATLSAGNLSSIVTGDAWKTAARDAKAAAFELIFLDPPYRDTQDTGFDGCVARFLRRLAEPADVPGADPVPLIVLHHFGKVRFSNMPVLPPWAVADERRLGSSAVTFFIDGRRLDREPQYRAAAPQADLSDPNGQEGSQSS